MIEKFSVGLGTFVPCLCDLFDFGLVLVLRIRYNLNPDTRPMTAHNAHSTLNKRAQSGGILIVKLFGDENVLNRHTSGCESSGSGSRACFVTRRLLKFGMYAMLPFSHPTIFVYSSIIFTVCLLHQTVKHDAAVEAALAAAASSVHVEGHGASIEATAAAIAAASAAAATDAGKFPP